MAISFDAASYSSTTVNTQAHTCSGINRLLVVTLYNSGSYDNITAVTYAGTAMTRVSGISSPISESAYMYYLLNPATGANNIVITGTASYISSASYTGVKQSGALNATASTAFSTTPNIDTSITTTVDHCWLVGFFRAGGLQTPHTGTTFRAGVNTSIQIGDSNGPKSPAGTYSMGTDGPSYTGQIVAAFEPTEPTRYLGEYLGAGTGITKALYHLNGNSLDSSRNGYNLTWTGTAAYVNGRFGQCASFNGTDNYLSAAAAITATDNFTIMCWAYLSGTSLKGAFVNLGSLSDNLKGYCFGVGSGDGIDSVGNKLVALANGVASLNTSRDIGTGWHHIGLQRIGGTWYTILDGVQLSQGATDTPNAPTTATVIGCANPTYGVPGERRFFDGEIDEVIIENVARDASKVKKYYTYAKGRFGL